MMITLKSCPVCGSFKLKLVRQAIEDPVVTYEFFPGIKVNTIIISRYFECQDCNLIFQNPRLTDDELSQFYSQGYYRQTLEGTESQMDNNEAFRAKNDGEIIKKYIGNVGFHLDIGCSRGYLLDEVGAKLKVGVESNVDYVKVKDIEVYSDISQVPQKSFELVTAIHVLEHVPYPLEFLKTMAKFVSKSGFLVIEVPTWKSPGGPLRLAHLFHFEPDVLKLMCVQVGLEIIHLEFTPHLLLICKLSSI